MTCTKPRRGGFTLVELLVVIGLIAVLATIAAMAAFRASSGAKASATEVIVGRLDAVVRAKYRSVVESAQADARKQAIPPTVTSFCGDAEAAAVVWSYLKLKNELPTTLREAVTHVRLSSTKVLDRRGSFAEFESAAESAKVLTIPDGSTDLAYHESAACLYKIAEAAGALEGLENHIAPLPGGQFRSFRDSWGQPIAFVRMGYASDLPTTASIRPSNDPLDSQNRLSRLSATNLAQFWQDATLNHFPYTAAIGANQVKLPATSLDAAPLNTYPALMPSNLRNSSIAVISAGGTTLSVGNDTAFGDDPFSTEAAAADNIVSYRVGPDKKKGF